MTFEPTPTMIDAVLPEMGHCGDITRGEGVIQALITHLQNNPDDAHVFAEGFMKPVRMIDDDDDLDGLHYAYGENAQEVITLYRLPEVQHLQIDNHTGSSMPCDCDQESDHPA